MRKLPAKSIKYRTSRYKLVLDSELARSNYWGKIDHKRGIISVDPELCESLFPQTLLHELLHLVDFQGGLKLKENHLDALAFGLIDLLRQNKWLGPFLTGDKDT